MKLNVTIEEFINRITPVIKPIISFDLESRNGEFHSIITGRTANPDEPHRLIELGKAIKKFIDEYYAEKKIPNPFFEQPH